MIAKIYITGQIGSTYDDNGNVTSKGVELINVVEQVLASGEVERTDIVINSGGGYVEVGNAIAEFVSSIPNCYTIATEECSSIATKIHLAVPLANRKAIAGVKYLIHNPFFQNISGDATTLKNASESILEDEKELVNTYVKATGVDKSAISALMSVETSLTSDQLLSLNFISEIIQKETVPTMVLNYNQKQNKMNKNFLERAKLAMSVLTGEAVATVVEQRKALAMSIETDNGTLETPFEDLLVGDSAMIGAEKANGTYTTTDGVVIVCVDGVVTEITKPAESTSEESMLIQANATIEALNATIETLTAENNANITALASSQAEASAVVEQLELLASKKSSFVPPASAQAFNKGASIETKTMKELAKERKEGYTKK